MIKLKVPRYITVGAYNYRITYVPHLVDDYKLLGQSLTDRQLIKIEPDTSPQTSAVTFWHETVHAIEDVYGCGLDEKDIDRIAQGLAAILKNDFSIEFDWGDIKEG